MTQSYFPQNDDDNIARAKTLHTIYKVSFLVLENRFRLDWAVTFPSTVEGKDPTQTFLIFMGFLMPHKVKADVPLTLPR